ncbi:MAG: hypothetical protein IAE94_13495 [Chthoniobacterales bacterium]|nr:hypothetical protein [Chthoniobacterales bacterium]
MNTDWIQNDYFTPPRVRILQELPTENDSTAACHMATCGLDDFSHARSRMIPGMICISRQSHDPDADMGIGLPARSTVSNECSFAVPPEDCMVIRSD